MKIIYVVKKHKNGGAGKSSTVPFPFENAFPVRFLLTGTVGGPLIGITFGSSISS